MSRTNPVRFTWSRLSCAVFATLLSAAGEAPAADLPPIGSPTSDGFTVSAWWFFTYHSKKIVEEIARFPGGGGGEYEVLANADVTEEVNKKTGQVRATIRNGKWTATVSGIHFTDREYGTRVPTADDASASGKFREARVQYGIDNKTKQPTVWLKILADAKVNFREHPLDMKGLHAYVDSSKFLPRAFSEDIIGDCVKPFKHDAIYCRHRSPPDGSPNNFREFTIIRTERSMEAEIKPAYGFNFKDWVPTMTGEIPFEVRMVDPPNLPVQWKFFLLGTSHHPGVCCNANIDDFPDTKAKWQNQIKKGSPDLIFDFRKYGRTDTSFKPVAEPWQVMETSKPATSVGFIVNCLDYGASGTVAAVATIGDQTVGATYKETGDHFIRIPYSTSNEYNHRIAHAARPYSDWEWVETYESFGGDKPDADDDAIPEGRQSCKGDGLTLFEEYRGFFVRDNADPTVSHPIGGSFGPDLPHVHRRLHPGYKDVFIFMDDDTARDLVRYLADFQDASKLHVHFVGDDLSHLFVNPQTRVVNFNRGDIGSDQHAIQLINYPFAENGLLGLCDPDLGPPGKVHMVYVDVDKINGIVRRESGNFRDYLKQVVIHELGHAVGIEHHGNIDKMHDSKYGELAREGGQHSGDIECAMRYVGADFYLHNSSDFEPNPKYHRYDNKREHLGLSFCNSPKGTGFNEKTKPGPYKPDWYCGNAQSGNCMAQIVVNDKCGGGSGGTEDRTGSGGASAASAPDDPAEKSARQSQSQAHVSARLSAGGKTSLAVIPGEAVVFELRLGGLANASLELGKPGEPWPRQVSFKMLDANQKLVPLPASVRPAGRAMQLDPQAGKDGGPPPGEMTPSPEHIKIALGSRYRASFALDAGETAKLPAGQLRIFAQTSGQPLTSTSVGLKVRRLEELSADEQARAEATRVLSRARLAFAEEKFADAEQLAREAAAKLPDSVEARLILARSLERQKKLREAYDAYGQALERTKPASGKADEPPLEIIFAMRWLREQLHIEPEPPPIVAGPLAAHSLFAESGVKKLNPPFPSHPDQLIFEWQLDKASSDPVGVRWIAADTSGAALPDHLIATSKSDSGKAEGRFTLKSPTAGFPPGQYRVEIWQAGKMIYSEEFQIKSE